MTTVHDQPSEEIAAHLDPAVTGPLDPYHQAGFNEDAYVEALHDRGLVYDVAAMSRRALLVSATSVGALTLVGFSASAAEAACTTGGAINSETAGPYPADGTNSVNGTTVDVRTISGITRRDIRSSVGVASPATAAGVLLTFTLTIQDLTCQPVVGAAVYAWHADAAGKYSLYFQGLTAQNYLRGIQVTDSSGSVTFTSVVPGCYSGRWPHIHFEVYSSLANATSGTGKIVKTSQMALPQAMVNAVYTAQASQYTGSTANLSQVSLASDNVFGDDSAAHQLATTSGSVSAGYTAALTLSVDPSAVEAGGSAGGTGGTGGAAGAGGRGIPIPGATPSASPTTAPRQQRTFARHRYVPRWVSGLLG